VCLTRRHGRAKFVDGLRQVIPPEEITIIVQHWRRFCSGGDCTFSPDIDSITYALSGLLSRERGWGREGRILFFAYKPWGQLGEPTWFIPATAILHAPAAFAQLAEGKTLSQATATIARSWV